MALTAVGCGKGEAATVVGVGNALMTVGGTVGGTVGARVGATVGSAVG